VSCRRGWRLLELTPKIARPDHSRITEPNLLRLNTFGRLFLERDGQRLTGAASQPRRLALLALLASAGEHGLTRDRMLGMLWPESDEERARKGLNQALYALRQEMGADEVFLGTRDIRLNPDLITSDRAAFTQALKAGQLERAAAEYVGAFLEGFHISEAPEFERWLEEERAELAREHATALHRLAQRCAERGAPIEAAEWWRKLAAQDPLNARVAIGLMEALVAAGDRPGALQHARVYEVLVQQELEAPPDHAVVALATKIRRQSTPVPVLANAPGPAPPISGPAHASPAPAAAPDPLVLVVEPIRPADPAHPVATAPSGSLVAPPESAAATPTAGTTDRKELAQAPSRRLMWAVGAVAVAGLALAAATLLRPRPPQPLRIGRISRITAQPGLEIHPSLSPDGKFIAYATGPTGRLRIYVRQLAGGRPIAVAESVAGDQHWPRWSPDGTHLSFEAGRAIYEVPALGGPAKMLVAPGPGPSLNGEGALTDEGPGYLAWSPDGRRIAYAAGREIHVRAVAGGPVTRIATVDQPHSFAWSPDGSRLAFVSGNSAFVYAPNAIGNIAPSSVWTVAATGGEPARVTDASSLNTSPEWLPDGRNLLFISNRDGSRDIYRVDIGPDGRPSAAPQRVTTGLQLHGIDLSRDGKVLVYSDFSDYSNIWSLPIPQGAPVSSATAEPLTTGHQSIEGMAFSGDGRWLAFDSDRSGQQAIYRIPVSGGDPELLSADSGDDFMPSWSRDGRELAYYGFRHGRRRLFVMPVDGGPASAVAADSGNQRFPDWAPDGRRLVFHSDRTGRFELYVVDRDTAGRWSAPRQLTTQGGQEARWSLDGRAIVYVRNAGLWLISPSGAAPRLLVDTRDPAVAPAPLLAQWSPDGRTIYFKALDAEGRTSLWAIPEAGGQPRLLVRFDDLSRPSSRPEFATDGKRFYFTTSERESDIWQMELGSR
jgi:Tol biopolymer transport system component/DNA-binding SARP family transcriptional activator